MLEIPLIDGIHTVLHTLKSKGYRLGIVSSNGEENIRRFLKHHDVDVFEVIHTGSSLFGKHRIIDRFLSKFDLNQREVVFIGDEVRDVEAAQKSGIHVIAVTWGFNSHEALLTLKPDKIVTHPTELLPALSDLNQHRTNATDTP